MAMEIIQMSSHESQLPLVSVITVNYNGRDLLRDCFESLVNLHYPQDKIELIMVDNGSTDDSVAYIKETFPQVKIIVNNENNYTKANNLGIRTARGDYIALINNDTKVEQEWLISLVRCMREDDTIGAVGSKILFMDGRIQNAGHLELPNYYWGDKGIYEEDSPQFNQRQETVSVSNSSALYRREALDEVGLFDEDFGMYMEDVDMAFRLRQKKWKVVYVPESIAYHKLHGSRQDPEERQFYIEKNRLLFVAKHAPHKLPDVFFGNGEIIKLSPLHFHAVLTLLFYKLILLYGAKEAEKIFSHLSKSIELMQNYRDHCAHIESARQISLLNDQIALLRKELEGKATQLEDAVARIEETNAQLRNKDKQLKEKDAVILTKESEISKIYNSETYRLFVRPLVWPTILFIKNIIKYCKLFVNKITFNFFERAGLKKEGIHIAQVYASDVCVSRGKMNEYDLKIINMAFRNKKATLTVDIRPYDNPASSQRHYAHFSTELAVRSRSELILKLRYDWEKAAQFTTAEGELEIADLWRGNIEKSGLYIVNVEIKNQKNTVLDKVYIVQKLEARK